MHGPVRARRDRLLGDRPRVRGTVVDSRGVGTEFELPVRAGGSGPDAGFEDGGGNAPAPQASADFGCAASPGARPDPLAWILLALAGGVWRRRR